MDDLLRRKVEASMANKKRSVPIDVALKRVRAVVARKVKAGQLGA